MQRLQTFISLSRFNVKTLYIFIINVFTGATLSIAGTNCRRLHICLSVCLSICPSVRPSVTSWCFIETAKRRITQTTPHNSPGTSFLMPKILAKLTRDHPQGGAKSKTGRLNADEVAENCVFRREVLSSYCGRKFVTLSVHLHVRQDAARRAGLPATAYPCYGRPIGQAILFWSCGFFYLSSFFFSSPQRSQIGCLPYFHT